MYLVRSSPFQRRLTPIPGWRSQRQAILATGDRNQTKLTPVEEGPKLGDVTYTFATERGSGAGEQAATGFRMYTRVGETGRDARCRKCPRRTTEWRRATDELAIDLHRGRRVRELRAIAGQRLRRAGSASFGTSPAGPPRNTDPCRHRGPNSGTDMRFPRHHRPKRHRSSNHRSKNRRPRRRTRARGGTNRGAGRGTAFGRVNSAPAEEPTAVPSEEPSPPAEEATPPPTEGEPSPPADEPSPPAEEPSPSPSAEPSPPAEEPTAEPTRRPRRSQRPFRLRLQSSNQPRCQLQHPPRSQLRSLATTTAGETTRTNAKTRINDAPVRRSRLGITV